LYVRDLYTPSRAWPQEKEGDRLALKVLSPGEKQIASLFSQMYLSGQSASTARVYAFVEGFPDQSFYRPHIEKYLPSICSRRPSGTFSEIVCML